MKLNAEELGAFVRTTRKSLGATQKDLAMTSGTGLRFIVDLEKGKPTCQIGKALRVVATLGVEIDLRPPDRDSIRSKI